MPSIFAALDEGGRLLLVRVYGGVPPPQFPTVALLSSLVSYGENIGVGLREISSDDVRIVFRRIDATLLVIVTNDILIPESNLEYMLKLVYNAVILVSGQVALLGPGGELPLPDTPGPNVDGIKRAWRGSVSLIDSILSENGRSLGLQLQMPEFSPTPKAQRQALEDALEKLVAAAAADDQSSSIAAAITWQGAFVAATPNWLSQNSTDLLLLQALIRSQPVALMRDIPVYLPSSSPEVPVRLLTADLTSGMELLMLAGQNPRLSDLSRLVSAHMGNLTGVLKDVASLICLPASNTFPGFEGMDALVAVSHNPPRCIGITAAAAALQSGSNPFDDSFACTDEGFRNSHGALIGSLVSFCHGMAPLVPIGREDSSAAEGEETIPKFSTTVEMQMMIAGSKLVHTGDSSTGQLVYAAFPSSFSNEKAMQAAQSALRALPAMQPSS